MIKEELVPGHIILTHENGAHLGDLIQCSDGSYYWWPPVGRDGCYPAYMLGLLKEELDKLNKGIDYGKTIRPKD